MPLLSPMPSPPETCYRVSPADFVKLGIDIAETVSYDRTMKMNEYSFTAYLYFTTEVIR
jgi:hypothetical protein